MVGSGTSNRIKGILNKDNLSTKEAGTNGDALALKTLTDAVQAMEDFNAPTEGLGWVTSPALKNRAQNVLAFNVNGSKLCGIKCQKKEFVFQQQCQAVKQKEAQQKLLTCFC